MNMIFFSLENILSNYSRVLYPNLWQMYANVMYEMKQVKRKLSDVGILHYQKGVIKTGSNHEKAGTKRMAGRLKEESLVGLSFC